MKYGIRCKCYSSDTENYRSYRLQPYNYQKQPKMRRKSPQVVKHVVKGEKWACSTLEVGGEQVLLIYRESTRFREDWRGKLK